jgi:hypothetical protein
VGLFSGEISKLHSRVCFEAGLSNPKPTFETSLELIVFDEFAETIQRKIRKAVLFPPSSSCRQFQTPSLNTMHTARLNSGISKEEKPS